MKVPRTQFIKDRLAEAGITQSDIARDLGVTRQCVNAALNRECVSRVREHVALLLGMPASALFPPKKKKGPQPR